MVNQMVKTFTTRSTLLRTVLALAAALAISGSVAAQDAAKAKRGEEVYTAQKCQICHGIAGKGSKANPLDGVGTKLTADDIRQWITHPTEMAAKSTKKPPMPNKYGSLPAADIDALVAYMASLK
jgi:mono/diheme cytochrome c family protein